MMSKPPTIETDLKHTVMLSIQVHGGIDDKRLEELQEELMPNMAKISRDNAKAPKWMDVTRNMTPDFVVKVSFKLLIELF